MNKKAVEKKNVKTVNDTAEYYELVARRKKLALRSKKLKEAGREVPLKLRQELAKLKREINKGSVVLGKGFTAPKAKDIKLVQEVTVIDDTTIAELAKILGMRPSGLVSRLFRHGTTVTGTVKIKEVKNIVKVLNAIGKVEGFKVTHVKPAVHEAGKLVDAFSKATRNRRTKKPAAEAKELTPITISPRAAISDFAEKLGIGKAAMIKHYFALQKPVSVTQTVASGGRRRAQEIAKNLGFKLTFITKGAAAKKVSQSSNGLTLRQLEEEIYKVDGLRVVFRERPSMRSGVKQWIQKMPEGSTIGDLCKRLRNANSELKDIPLVLTDLAGQTYTSSGNLKQKLSEIAF